MKIISLLHAGQVKLKAGDELFFSQTGTMYAPCEVTERTFNQDGRHIWIRFKKNYFDSYPKGHEMVGCPGELYITR